MEYELAEDAALYVWVKFAGCMFPNQNQPPKGEGARKKCSENIGRQKSLL